MVVVVGLQYQYQPTQPTWEAGLEHGIELLECGLGGVVVVGAMGGEAVDAALERAQEEGVGALQEEKRPGGR